MKPITTKPEKQHIVIATWTPRMPEFKNTMTLEVETQTPRQRITLTLPAEGAVQLAKDILRQVGGDADPKRRIAHVEGHAAINDGFHESCTISLRSYRPPRGRGLLGYRQK
jgi:hypothetical protein